MPRCWTSVAVFARRICRAAMVHVLQDMGDLEETHTFTAGPWWYLCLPEPPTKPANMSALIRKETQANLELFI